jgi:hypothetical protein
MARGGTSFAIVRFTSVEFSKAIDLWPCLGLLVIVLATGPALGYAQSAGWPQTAWASPSAASPPSGPGRLLGLRLPIIGFATSMDSAGRTYSVMMNPADHGRLTTTIEYRLSPRGPIGSLGLQTAGDGPALQPYEVNNAAAGLGPHGPEAKVGARISYRF